MVKLMDTNRKVWNILLTFLIIPFISPLNWSSSSAIESIYYPYKYLVSVIIITGFLILYFTGHLKKKRDNRKLFNKRKIARLFIIYYLIYIVNTLIQAQNYFETTLKACLPEIAFVLVLIYWLNFDMKHATRNITFIFFIYSLINVFLGVLSPEMFGTEKYDARYTYLLGERNALIYFLLPALIMTLVNQVVNGAKRSYSWVMMLIVSATILLTGSSTALAVILICYMLLVLSSGKLKVSYNILAMDIKAKTLCIIYMILWVMFVIIQNASLFSFFIEGILGRSLTFTNRTLIWSEAILLILEAPVFGYGGYFIQHITIGGWTTYTCHNFFLQNMVDAGFVSVIILLIIIGNISKEFDRHRNNQLLKILKIGIFAIFISCYMEAYDMHYIVMFCIYVCHIIEINILPETIGR